MPPDPTDTKCRILRAARDEFAEFGLAGARVERIARKADANKRSLYVHFGPKEALFDLTIARALQDLAEHVPFTPDDLPHYAGALFDYLVATPDVLRLTVWAGLERPEASAAEKRIYRPKIAALKQRFGAASADVLALLLGMVTSWMSASPALRAHAGKAPWSKSRLTAHRERMVAAVAAVIAATLGANSPPHSQSRSLYPAGCRGGHPQSAQPRKAAAGRKHSRGRLRKR